jgi:hypothetical protein
MAKKIKDLKCPMCSVPLEVKLKGAHDSIPYEHDPGKLAYPDTEDSCPFCKTMFILVEYKYYGGEKTGHKLRDPKWDAVVRKSGERTAPWENELMELEVELEEDPTEKRKLVIKKKIDRLQGQIDREEEKQEAREERYEERRDRWYEKMDNKFGDDVGGGRSKKSGCGLGCAIIASIVLVLMLIGHFTEPEGEAGADASSPEEVQPGASS